MNPSANFYRKDVAQSEKLALAAEFLALGVHVVHELVDEGDGDLLDLGFGVGHLADENVAGGIDAAFGGGVEHTILLSTWMDRIDRIKNQRP